MENSATLGQQKRKLTRLKDTLQELSPLLLPCPFAQALASGAQGRNRWPTVSAKRQAQRRAKCRAPSTRLLCSLPRFLEVAQRGLLQAPPLRECVP